MHVPSQGVSQWFLFNASSPIFQLYHGLSQARPWISNIICCCLFFFMFNDLKWKMMVSFVGKFTIIKLSFHNSTIISDTSYNLPCPFWKVNWIYLPNLLELLFIEVWAFPNASSNGLTCRICCSSCVLLRHSSINCLIISFVLSVLPAPLSPLKYKYTV